MKSKLFIYILTMILLVNISYAYYIDGFDELRKTGNFDFNISGEYTFYIDNTSELKITSTGLGIGQSTPLYPLDINGGMRIGDTTLANEGAIRYRSNNFEGYNGTDWTSMSGGSGSGSSIWLLNNSDTYYKDGNVGIGTSNASAKLHIAGEGENVLSFTKLTGTGNYYAGHISGSDNSTVGIYAFSDGYTTISEYTGKSGLQMHNGPGFIASLEPEENLEFYVGGRTATHKRMVINGSTGYVGIGTSNPIRTLDVTFDASSGTPGLSLNDTQAGGHGWGLISGGSGVGEFNIRDDTSGQIMFTIENNTGSVGIGTTDPLYKLDVSGGMRIGDTTVANEGAIRYRSNTFEGYNGSAWTTMAGGAGGTSIWQLNGADTYYNDGKVGIGTSIPSGRLHINTTTDADVFLDTAGANRASLRLRADGTEYWLVGKNAQNNFVISDQNAGEGYTFFINETNQKIGINTSAPNATLHVVGDILAEKDICLEDGTCLGNVDASVTDNWINETGDTTGDLTQDLNIDSNTFVISYDDNRVGIGTNAPDQLLQLDSTGASYLHIEGDTGTGLIIDSADASEDATIEFQTASATQWRIAMDSPAALQGDLVIAQTNNPTEPSMLFQNDGKVGIGMQTVNEKFSVNGNVSLDNTLFVNGSKIGIGSPPQDDSIVYIPNVGSDDLGISFGGLKLYGKTTTLLRTSGGMEIDRGLYVTDGAAEGSYIDGDLAIGTTTGSERIFVQGSGNITGYLIVNGTNVLTNLSSLKTVNDNQAIQITNLETSNTTQANELSSHDSRLTELESSNTTQANDITGIQSDMFNTTAGATNFVYSDNRWLGNNTFYNTDSANLQVNGSLRLQDLLGVTTIFLNGSNGRVGIGTDNPDVPLRVLGRVDANQFRTRTDGSVSSVAISVGYDDDNGFYRPAVNEIGVVTAGTERIRIDATGNIGIGTTSPGEKLQVDGNINVTTGNDICIDGGACLSTVADSATDKWINETGDTTGDLVVDLNIDSNTFVISYDDNQVGIGTATPANKLEIQGSFKATSQGSSLEVDDTGSVIIEI